MQCEKIIIKIGNKKSPKTGELNRFVKSDNTHKLHYSRLKLEQMQQMFVIFDMFL